MAVIVSDDGRRLTLTGYVGESTLEFDGWTVFDGFTHPEVVFALGEIGDDTDLEVHINSGGGYAIEGSAIRSALADRTGRTDIVIDGIAASAASLIAMAGNNVSMSLGSLMMIHDPSGLTYGTVEDHEKSIKSLNSLGSTYARVYSRKSGKPDAECRQIMRDETWFTPEEAVEAGFADEALEADADPVAAFPYQTYAHAPRELVAKARENGWRVPAPQVAAMAAKPAAPPASTAQQKEKLMPGQNDKPADKQTADLDQIRTEAAADAIKADRERRSAIMALDEAKGRESLADHLYANTEMDVEQVKATLAASPVTAAADPEPEGDDAYDRARARAAHGAGLGGEPKPTAPKGKGQSEAIKAAADKRKKRAAR